MNVELIHKNDQFTDIGKAKGVHGASGQRLPLLEVIDCRFRFGYDSIVLEFWTVDTGHPQDPAYITDGQLARIEKYFCGAGEVKTLRGRWRHQAADKLINADPSSNGMSGGTETHIYDADWFVLEGQGSTLAFRMQSIEDFRKIILCERDETKEFRIRWTGEVPIIGRDGDDKPIKGKSTYQMTATLSSVRLPGLDPMEDEKHRLGLMDEGDIRLLAQQVGVKWDDTASLAVMVGKVATKRLANRKKAETPKDEMQPA